IAPRIVFAITVDMIYLIRPHSGHVEPGKAMRLVHISKDVDFQVTVFSERTHLLNDRSLIAPSVPNNQSVKFARVSRISKILLQNGMCQLGHSSYSAR